MQANRPSAYCFWYQATQTSKIQYLYVIAFSERQAFLFFCHNGYKRMYDYDNVACNIIHCDYWQRDHNIGDILGDCAIL